MNGPGIVGPRPDPDIGRDMRNATKIRERVGQAFGVSDVDLISARKDRPTVRARQVAIVYCRLMTDLSMPAIAGLFGHKDHTIVIYCDRAISALCRRYPVFRYWFLQLFLMVKGDLERPADHRSALGDERFMLGDRRLWDGDESADNAA